jgi:hypothetical protein
VRGMRNLKVVAARATLLGRRLSIAAEVAEYERGLYGGMLAGMLFLTAVECVTSQEFVKVNSLTHDRAQNLSVMGFFLSCDAV